MAADPNSFDHFRRGEPVRVPLGANANSADHYRRGEPLLAPAEAGGETQLCAGTSAGVATCAGALSVTFSIKGDSQGVATAAGDLTATFILKGQSQGIATCDGNLTIGVMTLAGTTDGSSTAAGNLTATFIIKGQSQGVATCDGSLTVGGVTLAGTIAGTSTASGSLSVTYALSGTSAGTSTTSGVLFNLLVIIVGEPAFPNGVVPVSDLTIATGANIETPSFDIETDGPFGPQLRRLKIGELVFNFADTPMFGIGLWDTTGPTYYELIEEEWDPVIETDAESGVVTITLQLGEHEPQYEGIAFEAVLTPAAEGYQVSNVAMNNANATYSVEWFEFPRLGCQNQRGVPGDSYLAHGFPSGLVLKNPHLSTLTDVFNTALSYPPNMQFLSYWDISTKEHLYLSMDDDGGCTKHTMLTGDGSSVTTIAVRHWFPNPRRAGNAGVVPYEVPYNVNIDLFKGRTQDGRCGYYDAALRYRSWATSGDRPWIANGVGSWINDPEVSDRVKNSDFYYITGAYNLQPTGTPWSDMVTDMSRIKTFIGSDEMLGLLYGWSHNMAFLDDLQPPAFTPLFEATDQNTALGVAAAADIHLSYYTLPAFWETTLIGVPPFDFEHFIGNVDYNDMLNFIIRDVDGDPFNFDPQPGTPIMPDIVG